MASNLDRLENALIRAHEAGDTEAAQLLAGEIRHARVAEQIANDPISRGARNFANEIPVGQQIFAGFHKAVRDVGRGAGQMAGVLSQADIDEAKQTDAPLMRTGGGIAGNILGNAAVYAPMAAIPGMNTYKGAALMGEIGGALMPVATGESRLENTLLGGASGMAGQAVGNAVGRVISPVSSRLTPEAEALAREAERRGIPLTAGQRTGSKPLQIAESVLENLPLTSGSQLARKQAQREAFNKAVGGTFGSTDSAITPDVVGTAKSRIGQQFTDLASRNTLNADDALISALAKAESRANRELTPDVARIVNNKIEDIFARIQPGDTMPGTAYRALDSELGRQVRNSANGDVRNAIGELRSALRNAMDSSISPADQAAWNTARRQYANLMTVAPEAAKSPTGDISGRTLLSAALRGNRNAKFGGPSDIADLGRIGKQFIADQVQDSGSAQRLAMQSLLTGGGGAGVGAAGAYATGNNPMEGALYGAGVGAAGLVSPRVIQALMNSKAGQAYLKNQVMTPGARKALAASLQTGAIASMPAIENAK